MATKVTRREFIRGGVAAFTVSFAAPAFLVDIARAQGAVSRNLVVIYLAGGNDALSTIVPYTDPFYYSRRPAIAVPAANVLQIGSDSAGRALGLHPRLTGLQTIFNQGRLAIIQRAGYQNSSRSHFQGTDIWGTADPNNSSGTGWLALSATEPRSVSLRSALRLEHVGRDLSRAHRHQHRGSIDHQSSGLQLCEPEQRRGSDQRAQLRHSPRLDRPS